MVPANITSHLNSCRVLKRGSFSSFSSKHNNQSDFFWKHVSSCNYCAQNQNIILYFSQSKDLSKTHMTQTPWPHWLSGLSLTPVFFPSLNSTHISRLAGPQMLHEHSSFLDLTFSVPEKCKEPLSLCFKAVSCTNEKLCGIKGSWCLCLTDGQKCERLCRIFSTDTYPFLTAKFSWWHSLSHPPLDNKLKDFSVS